MLRRWFALWTGSTVAMGGSIAYRVAMPLPNYHTGRPDCTCGGCVMARLVAKETAQTDAQRRAEVEAMMGVGFDAMTRPPTRPS